MTDDQPTLKVTTWREPEMRWDYRWHSMLGGGKAMAGHWVCHVAISPGSTLARYLGEPVTPPVTPMGALMSTLAGVNPSPDPMFNRDYHRVEAYGWTRKGAQRRALRRYRALDRESRMVEDTRKTEELEIPQ